MAFFELAHILCETAKPTIVLTDNKAVTIFFQTEAFPTALWNACDHVFQFNLKTAHIAGSVNTAADILSRLKLKVKEKNRLKVREDVQRTRIEMTLSSSVVADEKKSSLHKQKETEKETTEQK